MENLISVASMVKEILEEQPETRNDDDLLWVKVIERTAANRGTPDFSKTTVFVDFLDMVKCGVFPHFKSVSRARRKVQEKHPELRASKEVRAARSDLEKQHREFARHG